MLRNINIVFLVGTLLALYMMQGFLYPSGSIISQGLLMLILAIGSACFVGTILIKQNPVPVALFALFIIMLTLTYIISPKVQYGWKYESIGIVSTLGQFKNAFAFSLFFFIGYYSTIRQNVSEKVINAVFVLQFVSAVVMFFYTKNMLLLEYNRDAVTVNAAYKFVVLIPFLPLVYKHISNKIVSIGIVLVMISLIIMGSKRGAIMCMVCSMLFALFYYLRNTRLSIKKIIALLVVLLSVGAFIFYSIEQNEYLTGRLEGMSQSGIGARNIAYRELWRYWTMESSNFAYFFGNGSAASINVWGNYAHNDWLEILTDNGLLGVLIYFLMFVSFIFATIKSSQSFNVKLSMYLCLLIWFLQTCFSMGYTDVGNGVYTMLLGILTAKKVKCENEKYSFNEDIIVN